ncbi:lipid droplet-associated hydrolase [Aricia agestis]|uniref:lipid droplet-associated hydrolase n=1 Tax=Aricia agestis TaxID=91739 RepID=UPI001C205B22|nr:lipid droplet-associated hydrolase [Aricia agestis]
MDTKIALKKVCKSVSERNYSLLTSGDLSHLNNKDVVVCITGNPGLCEFYTDFATEVHKQTSLPVCVINHIGHEENENNELYKLESNKNIFNLEGQVHQKFDFITNHIDKNSKIHLVGHSIGAWMLVEMLDRYGELHERISSANLLFPTIQKLAQTKNGRFMNNYVKKSFKIIIFLCTLLQWLPNAFTNLLIGTYLTLNSLPWTHCSSIRQLLNPSVLEKVLSLAFEEMDTVKELNNIGMEKLKHFSNVIYGSKDNWAPVQYLDELERFKPELQVKIVDIDHSFVLKSSEAVATMVSDFINKRKSS